MMLFSAKLASIYLNLLIFDVLLVSQEDFPEENGTAERSGPLTALGGLAPLFQIAPFNSFIFQCFHYPDSLALLRVEGSQKLPTLERLGD